MIRYCKKKKKKKLIQEKRKGKFNNKNYTMDIFLK